MKRTNTNRGDKQMKKRTKTIIATLITLVLIPTIAFAAMHWEGTENVNNIKDNLDLIKIKMDGLESENKETIREIEILLEQEKGLREQHERELKDKQKEIEDKLAEIQEKNTEIQKVKTENDLMKQQLEQALRDVKEIEDITKEMVK